jgi:hypothetical protein
MRQSVTWERSSRAKSRENDFNDNVKNNKEVIKIEKHIVSNISVDSYMRQGHILLHKLEPRFDPNHGWKPVTNQHHATHAGKSITQAMSNQKKVKTIERNDAHDNECVIKSQV